MKKERQPREYKDDDDDDDDHEEGKIVNWKIKKKFARPRDKKKLFLQAARINAMMCLFGSSVRRWNEAYH